MRSGDYFNEFTLMVVSAVGAFAIGEYPEAVAVMLFYTIGETLQHGAVDRATRHIGQLLDTRPNGPACSAKGDMPKWLRQTSSRARPSR